MHSEPPDSRSREKRGCGWTHATPSSVTNGNQEPNATPLYNSAPDSTANRNAPVAPGRGLGWKVARRSLPAPQAANGPDPPPNSWPPRHLRPSKTPCHSVTPSPPSPGRLRPKTPRHPLPPLRGSKTPRSPCHPVTVRPPEGTRSKMTERTQSQKRTLRDETPSSVGAGQEAIPLKPQMQLPSFAASPAQTRDLTRLSSQVHLRFSGSDTGPQARGVFERRAVNSIRYQGNAPSSAGEAKILNLLSKIVVTRFFG